MELELNTFELDSNGLNVSYDLWDGSNSASVRQVLSKSAFMDYLNNVGSCLEDMRDYGRAIVTEFLIYLFGRAE